MLPRLGLLGAALGLSACSLINAYDDVLPGEGGGGSGSSTTTTSSGGGDGGGATTTTTTTTTTSSAGGGGEGGGGGGGPTLEPLDCAPGAKRLVQNTLTFTGTSPRFFKGVYGFAHPSGGQRIIADRSTESTGAGARTVQILEVTQQGVPSGGSAISVTELLDVQRIPGFGLGALTFSLDTSQSPPLGRVELYVWRDNDAIINQPFVQTILTSTAASEASGRFVHVGPEIDRVDVLLRTREGGGHSLRYYRYIPGSGVLNLDLASDPNSGPIDPRALLRTGVANNAPVHAFSGRALAPGAVGTRRSSFAANATITPTPASFGPNGTTVTDAKLFTGSSTYAGLVAIGLTTSSATLHVGEIGASALGSSSLSSLHPVHTFTQLSDFPGGGRAQVQGRTVTLIGPVNSEQNLAILIAQTGPNAADNGLRFLDPTVVPLDATSGRFTASAVVEDDPSKQYAVNGGTLTLLSAETNGTTPTAETLYATPLQCVAPPAN